MLPESQSMPNRNAVSCSQEQKRPVDGDSLLQLLSVDSPDESASSQDTNLDQRSLDVRLDVQSLVASMNMSSTINNMRVASSNNATNEVCDLFGGLSIVSFLETCSQLSECNDEDDDSRSVDSLQFYRRTGRLSKSKADLDCSIDDETTVVIQR